MPSFDVVSEIDSHELTNAVDQANRELAQRFDFKGTKCTFELKDFTVTMKAEVEFQLKQMADILKMKLAKRGIDAACVEMKDVAKNLAEAKQDVLLRHGIDQDCGKKVVKLIKDSSSMIGRASIRRNGPAREGWPLGQLEMHAYLWARARHLP